MFEPQLDENEGSTQKRLRRAGERLKLQVTVLGTFVAAIWLLELLDVFIFNQALNLFGVWPRELFGLWGILFMPLLHGGLAHVAANTLPFIILGWLVMLRRFSDFVQVTLITMFGTGLGLWLFGSQGSVYIGASGLIFGFFGFLLLRAYFERSTEAILLAVFVAVFYGGMIWSVLPQAPGISWEAHLLGFVSGAVAARTLSIRRATGR